MTAEELAQAVGATKAQILAYENGRQVPDPQRIRALAHALGVHPWFLMRADQQAEWTVADVRRACGLRAQDVVGVLGISPKIYRRFETEGIVPSRRPQFLDEAANAIGVQRRMLEQAMDRTPAVRLRRRRVAELVVQLAERYVQAQGPWHGPDATDPDVIELAAAYGRPLARTRRVMTYELGRLRQRYARGLRERVLADFETDRARQARAQQSVVRSDVMFTRGLTQIPERLESFHRNAQPSNVWQLLVDLYDADAVPRGEPLWAVGKFLTEDTTVLPPHLVDQQSIDDITLYKLSAAGFAHVTQFAGLYAALHPATRQPQMPYQGTLKTSGRGVFTLPNQQVRLVIPPPYLEGLQKMSPSSRVRVLELSPRFFLTVHPSSLAVTVLVNPLSDADLPKSLFDRDGEADSAGSG
ncbi:hypothetical protein BG418_01385 [Streptomyces sp. CBMA152]|nr:hypothetical protein [Streptomyces sp. CBMA152]